MSYTSSSPTGVVATSGTSGTTNVPLAAVSPPPDTSKSIIEDFAAGITGALSNRGRISSAPLPDQFTVLKNDALKALLVSHTSWTSFFTYSPNPSVPTAIETQFDKALTTAASVASVGFYGAGKPTSDGTPLSSPGSEPSPGTGSSSGSGALPAATTSSQRGNAKPGNSPGLVIAVAVLAALVAICLGAIAWLSYRRRRRNAGATAPLQYERKQDSETSQTSALQATISNLQRKVEDQDRKLDSARAALVKSGRTSGATDTIDDRTLNTRFVQLARHVQDLVFSHFASGQGNFSLTPDLKRYMVNVTNYSDLLRESKTRYLLIRSSIAQILVESWRSGELLSVSYARMNDLLSQGPSAEIHAWRSQTAALFKSSEALRHEQGQAIETITRRIAKALQGFDQDFKGETQLHQIVASASELAMDLASQMSVFDVRLESVGSTFSAVTMDDVLQEHINLSALEGRPVRLIVFPALLKYVSGNKSNQPLIVTKAQAYV